MNIISENKFWSAVSAVTLFLLAGVGYVYFTTPLERVKSNVDNQVASLSANVKQSEKQSDDQAPIPPRKIINQLQKREEVHRKDVRNMLVEFLNLGRGIERWFDGERYPKEGTFDTHFKGNRKQLQNFLDENFESLEQEDSGGILDGGGGGQQQQIDWPENHTQNMQAAQKQFWMIKRLVYNAEASKVQSIQSISFEDPLSPVTVLDGTRLADRFLVSCQVTLPPGKTGRFLSRLLKVHSDRAPSLMMHVNQFRMTKNRTTSQTIVELSQDENAQFIYPLQVKEDVANWKLTDGSVPKKLDRPGPVTLNFSVIVYDPYEPTIASLLLETVDDEYTEKDVKNKFQSIYTEQEVNRFLNVNGN